MNEPTMKLEDVRRALDAQNRKLATAHDAAKDHTQRLHVTTEDRERLELACVPRRTANQESRLTRGAIPC